eukprot:scaffold158317_cov28-Tisochrysis_lutea.AAC.5
MGGHMPKRPRGNTGHRLREASSQQSIFKCRTRSSRCHGISHAHLAQRAPSDGSECGEHLSAARRRPHKPSTGVTETTSTRKR